jgi:hypothetical protein
MYALVRWWVADGREAAGQKERYASLAGLIAGLLYVFIPYRLLDMYVRAALAETLLMTWFPWVFLAFDRLIVDSLAPGWQGRLLAAALSLMALLLTHVVAILAFPPLLALLLLYRLWTVRHERLLVSRIVLAAAAGIAALLLSAIFIGPLLAEGPLLNQETFTTATYSYERHWLYWGQFLSPFWGYGYSDDPTGANDGMGFQIGLMATLLALIAVFLRCRRAATSRSLCSLLGFLLVVTLGILWAMTPAAAPLWQVLPMASVLQFPWRLLALSSFTVSALGGVVMWRLLALTGEVEAIGGALAISILIVFASLAYAHPAALQPVEPWREDGRAVFQFEQEHPDMYGYTQQSQETFTTSPMTAQYAAQAADPEFATDRLERLGILQGEGEILSHYSRGHSFGGEVDLATPATIQVRIYDHPGWQVRLDGEPVPHRLSPPYGLVELDVPAGRHRIDVRMGSTPIRTASTAISIATFLGLIGLWGWSRLKR